ncbi:unnamed protein product [Dovyalis caffra]|uniref:Uncharacterized protein n=1 Tax=Dovyalis caffra TaxID=77055 RepID=A0AAV1SGA3_9ROSI|nr:unnamed protein product [Dovyalis caffra]
MKEAIFCARIYEDLVPQKKKSLDLSHEIEHVIVPAEQMNGAWAFPVLSCDRELATPVHLESSPCSNN